MLHGVRTFFALPSHIVDLRYVFADEVQLPFPALGTAAIEVVLADFGVVPVVQAATCSVAAFACAARFVPRFVQSAVITVATPLFGAMAFLADYGVVPVGPGPYEVGPGFV